MLLVPHNVATIVKSSDDGASRYAITGVHVKQLPNKVQLEATNGKHLTRITIDQDGDRKIIDYPEVPNFDKNANGVESAIIDGKSLSKALKAAKPSARLAKLKPILGNLAITLSGSEERPDIKAAWSNIDSSSVQNLPPIEGKWPDTDQIVKGLSSRFTIVLSVSELLPVLEELKSLDIEQFNLGIQSNQKPIEIKGRNTDSGVEQLSVIMPCDGENKEHIINYPESDDSANSRQLEELRENNQKLEEKAAFMFSEVERLTRELAKANQKLDQIREITQ